MTKFTPKFGWPVAEDVDVVKQYPTVVDDPFKMALEAFIAKFGSWCTASGTLNGLAAAVLTTVPLTDIANNANPSYVLNGGAIGVPFDGTYLLYTHVYVSTSSAAGATSIYGGYAGAHSSALSRISATATDLDVAVFAGGTVNIQQATAGSTLPFAQAFCNVAGADTTARQIAVFLGDAATI